MFRWKYRISFLLLPFIKCNKYLRQSMKIVKNLFLPCTKFLKKQFNLSVKITENNRTNDKNE